MGERKEDRVADGILDLARFLGAKIPVAPDIILAR